jgi:beta-glucosidase-like glycosyl hydrolase/CubicO group peptidase (beta-lactamase class C family)
MVSSSFTDPISPQDKEDQWVNELYKALSLDEKIGQLFMVRAFSHDDPKHISTIESYLKKYHLGGLCFFQGSPEKQIELVNNYQKISNTPLLIAIDAEWGLGMRFKNVAFSFPRQLTLGAIQDNSLIYEMGRKVAEHCKRIGIHVNFAPVVDINNNPRNPVINDRSFGEDKFNVAAKSYAYMRGLQDGGIIACAKHFPGHGDTDVDSHHDLPVINHDMRRIDSLELFPFKVLSYQGIKSMMVAHLNVPNIDSEKNIPTTLSKNAVTNILKKQLEFEGLIFTDALDMKGVTKHFAKGEVSVKAFLAGNDVLLLPEDVPKAFETFKKQYLEGKIPEERLEESVKKILRAKYRLDLSLKPEDLPLANTLTDLNDVESKVLNSRLIENALTLVSNKDALLPFKSINDKKYGSLSIGSTQKTNFQSRLDSYATFEHFQVEKAISPSKFSLLKSQLKNKDIVVVGLHDMSKYASKNFGISKESLKLIQELSAYTRVVVVIFGSPYSLKYFGDSNWTLVAYSDDKVTQDLTAQALFGAIPIKGKLPVTASEKFRFNMGLIASDCNRLGYSYPEYVGISSDSLLAIDTIVEEMIKEKAAPGCQILIAKEGKIIYQKTFGYHTYAKKRHVQGNDIYDVASVTKIAASTISLMKLYDQGKINLYDHLVKYVSELDTTNKSSLVLMDVLAHNAGLKGWIPFYRKTVSPGRKNPKPLEKYYRKAKSDSFSIMVSKDLYIRSDYRDTIWAEIMCSDLRTRNNYRYSDLGFYIIHEIIKNMSGQSLDQYGENEFYKPLGLRSTTFNPLNKFSSLLIAPSEKDNYFRNQIIQGYVHDMGAAMLGGVAGHAGLFSNAQDLAIIMQMLLNGGNYGGKQYLEPSTVYTFTTRHPRSTRRGLGFDMKELNPDKKLNMSEKATSNTFGHLGFTGTAVFADPDHDLIYIFLSNRTYPSMSNGRFGRNEYRPRIQSVIYNAIQN